MKLATLVTARMGSTRLPGKHLCALGRWTALETLCRRILGAFGPDVTAGRMCVRIATGEEPENRRFEELTSLGVDVHYGASRNIPLRHLQAAEAVGADGILAVDGDDILCSMAAMRRVADALEAGHDYAASQGLPLGMNAFGYGVPFLRQALAGRENEILETGWGRIFDGSRLHAIDMAPLTPEETALRFTLDYPEDLAFFQAVSRELGNALVAADDATVIRIVRERGLAALNAHLQQEYMRNFTQGRDEEIALALAATGRDVVPPQG